MNKCTNCGSDLSIVRIAACCNHPMRQPLSEVDFPFDPIPELQAEIERLREEVDRLKLAKLYDEKAKDRALLLERHVIADTAYNEAIEVAAALSGIKSHSGGMVRSMAFFVDHGAFEAYRTTVNEFAAAIRALKK